MSCRSGTFIFTLKIILRNIQHSTIESFTTVVNVQKHLTIVARFSILEC